MKTEFSLVALLLCFFVFTSSAYEHEDPDFDDFLECMSDQFKADATFFSGVVHTPNNSSYAAILTASIHVKRFASQSTPKPLAIITPRRESQIPPVIHCAKENGMEIRTRSGGHDFEGISSVSRVPFVILDLVNFSEITVDSTRKTAWVQSGATLGSLYYRIAQQSPTLGFPAGFCPTVGVGGHFSGGGDGSLHRKYGLAADNVVDARMVDANGRILDRKSMGEDLFWAIRGGGGGSFGVVLAWKVQLVDVPEKVTVFTVNRTLEQNATQLVHKWQTAAPGIDQDLWMLLYLDRANSRQNGATVRASFNALFLGGSERLLRIMQKNFPELGLTRQDCLEMAWVESALYLAGFPTESRERLFSKTLPNVPSYYKMKSDYVQKPIPESGLEGLWRLMLGPEAEETLLLLVPYGGRMGEIPESAIPFPHRAGNLYKFAPSVYWQEEDDQKSEKYINWLRRVYSYMAPYVSKSPRAAYVNYRDLDVGVNNDNGLTSYAQASIWGVKYFKNNFDRLVAVKTVADPHNFFRHEQSIPLLRSQ